MLIINFTLFLPPSSVCFFPETLPSALLPWSSLQTRRFQFNYDARHCLRIIRDPLHGSNVVRPYFFGVWSSFFLLSTFLWILGCLTVGYLLFEKEPCSFDFWISLQPLSLPPPLLEFNIPPRQAKFPFFGPCLFRFLVPRTLLPPVMNFLRSGPQTHSRTPRPSLFKSFIVPVLLPVPTHSFLRGPFDLSRSALPVGEGWAPPAFPGILGLFPSPCCSLCPTLPSSQNASIEFSLFEGPCVRRDRVFSFTA